ncbi:acetyl-CoA hydrolase/transferase family protein [Labilibaculum antarcticum]|uniref:4-hydroxybutyrate CoA-transferase n=1 Tax=Labilibaculum antarcticum TaxID=1717717 RepID=A0A1Y1CHG6_9BACT|nr:acetyl-CoA hydrolase/transferase C-terminal domain-containing protein [Labilibaculum antarcticum]BAX79807.1 4-hydroxybutyrate CoA-transferase [Labilibaculum antarcticum]
MHKEIKIVSFEEAAKVIKSGDRVHLHSVALAPHKFIKAMCDRGRNGEIYDVAIQHLHTEGPAPYADTEFEGIFNLESLFVGANVRKQTQAGYADYIPVFLSETQKMIRQGVLDVNVAVVQVSPPDKHGYVSLGTSIDCSLAAVETADTVVAIINTNVPRSFGDAMIPMSMCDVFCEDNSPLVEHHNAPLCDIEIAIGKNVANIIPDGACLQMGIGGIPNAVLAQLGNHKNLGIHTEMFADGLLPLVYSGVVNGMNKKLDQGKIVASFLMGTKTLYDFVDDNPGVLMMDVGYTNGVEIIRQNPKVCAINSALSIDITGQVCADSIGTRHYSGVGGQIDFTRGAAASEGGVPVIAMPSVTGKGVSKIAPTLLQGSGVVTTRNNMHWFATEYGCVNLYGKTLQQRAKAIISVAHPNFREELDQAAFERFGSHYHFVAKKY